jgi:hypothetical protein
VAPATIAGALPNEIEQNKVLNSFYVSCVTVVKDSVYIRKGGCNVAVMRMIFLRRPYTKVEERLDL